MSYQPTNGSFSNSHMKRLMKNKGEITKHTRSGGTKRVVLYVCPVCLHRADGRPGGGPMVCNGRKRGVNL